MGSKRLIVVTARCIRCDKVFAELREVTDEEMAEENIRDVWLCKKCENEMAEDKSKG
jgi:uncharacterized protein with PIN domain